MTVIECRHDMELFQPNNLSRIKPEFVALHDPEIQTTIIKALRDCYSLQHISDVRLSRIAGANVKSQNLLIDLPDAHYFLKRRAVIDHDSLKHEAKWAVELRRLGIDVPVVIPTSAGTDVGTDEQTCFVLYSFEDGDYFCGRDSELDAAAQAFASLTDAAMKIGDKPEGTDYFGSFLSELPDLLDEASRRTELPIGTLCQVYRPAIHEALEQVSEQRSLIESQTGLMHLDYHPLNLLMKDSKIACILDFEHIRTYPLLAGLGFAAYKLVRQAMVDKETRDKEFAHPDLYHRWLHEWTTRFPASAFTPVELGNGARYRTLYLISFILKSWLMGDDRFNYDLEKQIGSLPELTLLMRGYQ